MLKVIIRSRLFQKVEANANFGVSVYLRLQQQHRKLTNAIYNHNPDPNSNYFNKFNNIPLVVSWGNVWIHRERTVRPAANVTTAESSSSVMQKCER